MSEKKKAGQIVLEHNAQGLELEDDVQEYRRAQEPETLDIIWKTIQDAKTKDIYVGKDFYIVMMFTPDQVLRQPKKVIFARQSCPTPVFKQSVWKYRHQSGDLEFLWSIPDMMRYYDIVRNPNQYLADTVGDKAWHDIAKMVILMESGELLNWVKKENGEKKDAVIFVNRNEESECLIN
jgi:hypothetical protein